MTWTYSCDPGSSLKDEVRFLLGDTDIDDQLIKDEEIAFLLGRFESALGAAIQGAWSIAAKFARLTDEKTGDISVSHSKLAQQFRDLASQLQDQIGQSSIQVFAGGISMSDVDTRNEDIDRVDNQFEIGIHDDDDSLSQNTEQH